MEQINYLEHARSRYTDQHADDPSFDRIIQAIIEQSSRNQEVLIDTMNLLFDIELSEGTLLDLIGYMVGQDRLIQGDGEFFGFLQDFSALGFSSIDNPEMGGYWYSLTGGRGGSITLANDAVYRRLIKARIIFNNNLATPEALLRIINLLSNTTTSQIVEDGLGNITILVEKDTEGLVTHFLSLLSTERNLIPIPLGVSVSLNITGITDV